MTRVRDPLHADMRRALTPAPPTAAASIAGHAPQPPAATAPLGSAPRAVLPRRRGLRPRTAQPKGPATVVTPADRDDPKRQGLALLLRLARLERGWTLDTAAQRAGVSAAYVGQLETGIRRDPTFRVVMALATAYGIHFMALQSAWRATLKAEHQWGLDAYGRVTRTPHTDPLTAEPSRP